MNINKKIIIIVLFFLSFFVFSPLKYVLAESQNIVKPSLSSYLYGGMIKNISPSSITFYNGITIYITGDTKCTVLKTSIKGMSDVSCSDILKIGKTVRVDAIKNSSGELNAVKIEEVFY